ncbi:outer membrane lipoprotein carrier protein LolA [Chitinimonas koreensis]|uniref:outer membrane lipoprotein carrier protein LolA n=1 Tax=Chitinimonas koreensis TaxID=356302 RepID=UPI00040F48CF|nr:outer membrane lipoprotein carrier protein LolA [Chitinimonas koreensis]QNM95946.1 outer membrane lipoprotein carrier protein LolA [Chitinimonas koreensis]
MKRLIALACLALALPLRAAPLADEVKARLAAPPLLRGQFVQEKQVAGFKKPLVSSGDFLLWRDHGVLWHTKKPFDATLALTRDALSARQGDGRAGYRLDAGREPGLREVNALLFALLAGDVAALAQRFRIDGALAGKDGWTLQLAPLEPNLAKVFRRIELNGDRYVRQVKLEEANGDASLIRFDGLAEAPAASADEAQRLGR